MLSKIGPTLWLLYEIVNRAGSFKNGAATAPATCAVDFYKLAAKKTILKNKLAVLPTSSGCTGCNKRV